MTETIAITGGIGSGKSVVSRVLASMGYPVYDCDSRARRIMDSDPGIKARIAARVTPDALRPDGSLDRAAISRVVFADPVRLRELNSIVHGAVRSDIERWIARHPGRKVFIETAILYQSGLDRMVDAVWEVCAPEHMRVSRVCERNGLSEAEVLARIRSQKMDVAQPHPSVYEINNDGTQSLLLQVHALLGVASVAVTV